VLLVAGFLGVNALLPSHGGKTRASPLETAQRGVRLSPADVAEQRAAERSAAAVQPLATEFVTDLASHRHLDRAFALLAPKLREHYSQADWTSGRDLPLTGVSATSAGATSAFAGRTTAGFVSSLQPNVLFAVRFDKLPALGWRVAYVHEGHGSSYVSETSYSPAGFTPGSQPNTVGTWLILLGGFVALVIVVVLLDRRLSR
jgi:hypothetical protein